MRLQAVVVTDNFELDPVGGKQLARHLRQQNRFTGTVTTGCIGQQFCPGTGQLLMQQMPVTMFTHLLLYLSSTLPAQRYGNKSGGCRGNGITHHLW